MSWNSAQVSRFLAVAANSVHGPIWLVAVLAGLRLGESLGLQWQDVDDACGMLHIRRTVRLLDDRPALVAPRTVAAMRDVPVAAGVVTALAAHKRRQRQQRQAAGIAWQAHDLVFCRDDGRPLSPSDLQEDLQHWVTVADVPPLRIHDLRHIHMTLVRTGAMPRPRGTGNGRADNPDARMDGSGSLPFDDAGEEPAP